MSVLSVKRPHQQAEWFVPSNEGQLSLDAFRENGELVIRSLVAGVDPQYLDVTIHGDLLTSRGERTQQSDVAREDWLYQECYWGAFSRSVVLPYGVDAETAKATLRNGVLELRLKIRDGAKKVSVRWGT